MSEATSLQILIERLIEHSLMEGCLQCENNDVRKTSKDGLSHAAVRARMLDELMSKLTGRARLEIHEKTS